MPITIPSTEIFDMMFMKLELCFDRMNLYANNNRMLELYHSLMINKITMEIDNLNTEFESNTLIMNWPSCYKLEYYWNDLLIIYYQILDILIKNNKQIILAYQPGDDIEKDLKNIGYCLSNIKSNYLKNILLHEMEYDDIWVRDFAPLQLFNDAINKYKFYKLKFNGYGKKYIFKKDALFSKNIITYLQSIDRVIKSHKNIELLELCEDLVVEGGNIINDEQCLIMNKNPLIIHNDMSWSKIHPILEKAFKKNNLCKYYTIDVKGLTGDDTNGHIDNLVRIYDDKILYMSIKDVNHPNYLRIKNLQKQLQEIIQRPNNFNEIIPIHHDNDDVVRNKIGNILPFSYLNYIRVEDIVIIPVNKKTNEQKKKFLRDVFSDSNIYFIECSALLNQFGSLHCCTANINI